MAYSPRQVPLDPAQLASYLTAELAAIADAMARPNPYATNMQVLTIEPTKRNEGMHVFADGTTWNPGAGRGVYVYTSGAWSKL